MYFSEELKLLWSYADKCECDGDCDLNSPYKECRECRATRALNQIEEIIRVALQEENDGND